MVFAGFITLFGSQRLLSKFNKLCRRHEEDPTVVASPGFMDQATRALGPRFHGHMTGLHHSPGLRTQRFFMTFMARYHGLSVLGGDLLSPMGMMMPSSSYDTMLKSVVDIALLKGRYPIDMIERKEKILCGFGHFWSVRPNIGWVCTLNLLILIGLGWTHTENVHNYMSLQMDRRKRMPCHLAGQLQQNVPYTNDRHAQEQWGSADNELDWNCYEEVRISEPGR